MDYEELEFDLEILPDRIHGYDSYIYLGEFNNFLGNTTNRIELLFRMDILAGIIITLPLKNPADIVVQLENLLGSPQIVIEHTYNLYRFNNNSHVICITLLHNNSYVLVTYNSPISSLLSSLLW